MESNNISYLIWGIIIGSFIDLKLIFALVVIFALITNEPDFKGIRPRTLIASILYGIYLFILNLFYNFSNKTNNQELSRIEEVSENQIESSLRIVQVSHKSQLMEQYPIQLSRNTQELSKSLPVSSPYTQDRVKPIILNFNPISIYPGMNLNKKFDKI